MLNKFVLIVKQLQVIKSFVAPLKMPPRPAPSAMYRLARHDDLSKPDICPIETWKAACGDFLTENSAPQPPDCCTQTSIDEYWARLSLHLERMLRAVHSQFSPDDKAHAKPSHRKSILKFSKGIPHQASKLDTANESYRIRHLRNLLAQLRECRKIETHGRTSRSEYSRLNSKIANNPLYQQTLSISQNISTIQTQLHQERDAHRQTRISNWKHRLQNSSGQCFRWLKNPHVQPFRGLISEALNITDVTEDFPTSLILIRDHWRRVWNRDPPDVSAVLQRMRAELARRNLSPEHTPRWAPVDPVDLATRARSFQGKAAGPDGWSGNEICSMPVAAFELFASFCSLCETSGLLPSTWQIARQTHLPKGQKGVRARDGARDVAGLRPLTLFSAWYRLYAPPKNANNGSTNGGLIRPSAASKAVNCMMHFFP